jgi:hypothetical protein
MEFPGNSHKVTSQPVPEAPKEKLEKVVTGEVIKRSKPISQRLKNIFLGGELKGALRYITSDVLLPAMRNLIVDMTSKGIDRLVYGDSSPRRRPELNRTRYSYNSPVDRSRGRAYLPDQPPYQAARRHDINEVIIVSRDEAELVLERLTDAVDKYGVASVADLNELTGLPTTHIDVKWGWTTLAYANVRQVREGYLLELPPVEPI